MTELAVRTNLRTLMRSDDVTSRFSEVVGNGNAGAYISSVLIAVADSEALQKCSANSIIGSALRAASMRLSVDPSTGQAYLVPFGTRATLILGYKGLYHMALRTGKYRFINMITVYEGETVTEDRMTGLHSIEGHAVSKNPIGYMLYFKLLTGFEKTFYMTNDECDTHGREHSKNYNSSSSLWKTNKPAMYKKTVMRLGLTRWGYLDPADVQYIKQNDDDYSEIVDGETGEIINTKGVTLEIEPPANLTAEQAMTDLGFDAQKKAEVKSNGAMTYEEACDVTGSDGSRYGNATNAELQGKKVGILKALKNPNLDNVKQSAYDRKLSAIDILLAVPESERLERAGQEKLI